MAKRPFIVNFTVGCLAIVFLFVTTSALFYGLLSWPFSLGYLLNKSQGYLEQSDFIRWSATILFFWIAYGVYKLKNKSGIIVAYIEWIGGIATIYWTFRSKFDNDVLYALAISGGVFLMVDGFGVYAEWKKQDDIKKKLEQESKKNGKLK